MKDEHYDWSVFTLRIPVKADMNTVYRAFATQDGLESWFLRQAPFIGINDEIRDGNAAAEAGDDYVWRWHGWDDSVTERGKVLEANGKDHFSFVFGDAGTVSVHLKSNNEFVLVELIQSGIPEDRKVYYHIGCQKGWLFYLTNLKSILEGGIDLRNRDANLTGVINA